jgi:hypothetical protein
MPRSIQAIPTRSEHEDQVAVFEWAARYESRWPCLALLFGSLMGIPLTPKYLNKAIKAGMKKGKPDINLPVSRGGYHGLWIELKRKGGKKPEPDQERILRMLAAEGNAVYACHGSESAIDTITNYLQGHIRRDLWKPVETAPRDGTHILGIANGIMTTVYFEYDYFNLVECGAYADNGEWWPTHWMKLPEGLPLERR